MAVTFQLAGALAIVLGLVGTWLAGRRPAGWLVCVASTVLWFPALVTGRQSAAVINCVLSIGICLRNFRAGRPVGRRRRLVAPPGVGIVHRAQRRGVDQLGSSLGS